MIEVVRRHRQGRAVHRRPCERLEPLRRPHHASCGRDPRRRAPEQQRVMADYCRRNGVSLAPHGKTTMSPELFELQIRARRVGDHRGQRASGPCHAWTAGVPRVLIANEVTAPGDIRWLADQVTVRVRGALLRRLDRRGAAAAGRVARHATGIALGVLVELGVAGGRTGREASRRHCGSPVRSPSCRHSASLVSRGSRGSSAARMTPRRRRGSTTS